MTKISALALSTVTGGSTSRSSTNDQITQQLTALSSSIKDVASAPKQDNSMMMMAMMMMMRPQTNVVASGPPPVAVAAPAGPVVNIATRVR